MTSTGRKGASNMKDENATDNGKDVNGRGRDDKSGESGGGGKRNRGKRQRSRSPIDRNTAGRSRASGGESRANRRVYVANVAFDVKWSDLKDLFREKIGNVTYAQLFDDEQGRSRGCGLVEFSDSASAQKAIEVLHRYEFRNRELVVKEDLDCERDRYGRLLLPGAGGGGSGGGSISGRGRDKDPYQRDSHRLDPEMSSYDHGYVDAAPGTWNTYGLSPEFLENLGVSGPLNNRIFVANLDYKVGEKKLEEIFRLAGKVMRVRLYTDSSGTSKGHGTVEFDHPVEAVQAISMFNDQKLYGRAMSIRLDKYECEDMPEELPTQLPSGLEGVGKGLGIGGQPLNVAKSLLGSNAPAVVLPAQAPLAPMAGTSLPPLGAGMSGNLGQQLPPANLSQSIGQLSNHSVPQSTPAPSLGNLNLVGLDRSLQGPYSVGSHSQNPLNSNSLSSALNSLGSANVMNALNSLRASGIGVASSNPAPLSHGVSSPYVQSTSYEREFRSDADKYSAHSMQPAYRAAPARQPQTEVLVRSLPLNFNWQNLHDRFREIGDVSYAEIKGPGTGLVRFSSERDAQRAVDLMHGVRIDNRPIEVSFYY